MSLSVCSVYFLPLQTSGARRDPAVGRGGVGEDDGARLPAHHSSRGRQPPPISRRSKETRVTIRSPTTAPGGRCERTPKTQWGRGEDPITTDHIRSWFGPLWFLLQRGCKFVPSRTFSPNLVRQPGGGEGESRQHTKNMIRFTAMQCTCVEQE